MSMTDDNRDLHIRLSKELYTKLKVKCAFLGISMQDYIVNLLKEGKEDQTHTAKKTVLVVDDEVIVRDSLREWLQDSYEVRIAQTGEEAIDALKEHDFDVVLLDMRLTGKSGLEVLREVKEFKPYIKIIMVTAYPAIDLAVQAIKEGAVDYIVKPIAPDQLERMLFQTVNSGK
jgi:DNA-binding NtrC family response regulator